MARPPRIKGFSYRGRYCYSVTICAASRRNAFADVNAVARTVECLREEAAKYSFEIIAYCFMPDHVHFLVRGREDEAPLRRLVASFKQRSGYAYKEQARQRLWQDGYFEHTLRAEEDIFEVSRYILANPVRAGIVSRAEEYPFSGSDLGDIRELLLDAGRDRRG